MNRLMTTLSLTLLLSGCSTFSVSEADRLNDCESKGISRDVCYQQQRADARAALNRQPRVVNKHQQEVLSRIGLEER